ncbi:MAG: hypothetical protein ACE5Z5_01220 [Candidatus Bathyarchaeia archaeon]
MSLLGLLWGAGKPLPRVVGTLDYMGMDFGYHRRGMLGLLGCVEDDVFNVVWKAVLNCVLPSGIKVLEDRVSPRIQGDE